MFIRQLTIKRYRCLEHLEWAPRARVNCLIGPGDVGKSTVLSAIERLLDPVSPQVASEYDYFKRRVESGFEITAVIGDLDEEFLSTLRTPPLQGWLDGEIVPLPDEDGAEPVLVARAVGGPDLDVSHVLVTPGEAEDVLFPPSVRRRLLLSRITSGGRAASELRLGRGTLLDKHLNASELQGQLRAAAAEALAGVQLPREADETVAHLRGVFKQAGLPDSLAVGLIAPQGWSLLALFGLVQGEQPGEAIPLAYAGAGTRQLAMFRLAAALMGASPIVLMDEPEVGLEPYRQRSLVAEIRKAVGARGQAFLTTHSPAILEALEPGETTRLSSDSLPITLEEAAVSRVQREAPDALLSRLPVLCEGVTEAGAFSRILDEFATRDGLGSLDALGIRLVPRRGQPLVLDEADAMLNAGIAIGLFVDNEGDYVGRRAALKANPRCAYGSWTAVRNIEEAVSAWLPWEHLGGILTLAAKLRGRPVKELLQQVGQAIGLPGYHSLEELRERYSEREVRRALAEAMNAKHNPWFKTLERGRALGSKLLEIGLPDQIERTLERFWGRVLAVAGWGPKR